MLHTDIVQSVITLSQRAGEAIMEVYNQEDIESFDKADGSPLTLADKASHDVIMQGLKNLLIEYPILSEESSQSESKNRFSWDEYWLVDPLDGTKEFIKRNGEFTVNIAFISHGKPIMGVIYAPALKTTYWGVVGEGAYRQREGEPEEPIHVRALPSSQKDWKIVGSRSHPSPEFEHFMDMYQEAEMVSVGSSLKLCYVAEGKADIYPRLGPTMEWDTAAGQAIVEAAGGQVQVYKTRVPLTYNQKEDSLLNPYFIVFSEGF